MVKNLSATSRPPDKSVYWKIVFFISHPKHMFWVFKRMAMLYPNPCYNIVFYIGAAMYMSNSGRATDNENSWDV